MSPIRTLARPLMAATFVRGGVETLRHPADQRAALAQAGFANADQVVRVNGATMVAGGLALATGRLPRLSALALAASLVPSTYAGHAFWTETDKQLKKDQQAHFFKNLSLLGGLLVAVADTGGRESVPHAAGRITRRAQHKAAKAGQKASKATHSVVQSLPHVA